MLGLGLAAVSVLWLYVGRAIQGGGLPVLSASSVDARSSPWQARFRPLSAADLEQLRVQRALAGDLARRHVGTELTGRSLGDLRVLQEILDQAPPDDTWSLQALGVALGDVMVAQLGLRWVVFEDSYGRSRALRVGESEDVIFPVTMISKRVEGDVPFRVDELYRETARTVEASRGRSSGA